MREAGGCCTTRTGEAFVYNLPDRRHPSVLASGAELHDTLVALLGRS